MSQHQQHEYEDEDGDEDKDDDDNDDESIPSRPESPVPAERQSSERRRRWRSSSPPPCVAEESCRKDKYEDRSTTTHAVDDLVLNRTSNQDLMCTLGDEDLSRFTFSWGTDPPAHYRFTISSFKTLQDSMLRGGCDYIQSAEFCTADWEWQLQLHPRGNEEVENERLSLYLNLLDYSDLTNGKKLYVEKEFRIKDLKHNEDIVSISSSWYSESVKSSCDHLASLTDLHDPNKRFIDDNDMMFIQVKLTHVFLMDVRIHDS